MVDATTRRVYEIDAKLGSDALAAVRAMQQSLKSMEDAAKSSATSLKSLNSEFGADKGGRFLQSLKDQIATLGFSKRALDEYKAAQLGVSDAANPLIATLHEQTDSLKALAEVEKQNSSLDAAIASSENARIDRGTALVASLLRQRNELGKTADELQRIEAAYLGVLGPVDRLRAEIAQISAEQLRSAETARELARSEDEAAAADKRHSDAGQKLLATLKEQNAVALLSPEQRTVREGDNSGVGNQVREQLAIQKQLAVAQAATSDSARELARSEDEAAAADKRHSDEGQKLLATLRAQITANEQLLARGRPATGAETIQDQANASGVGSQAAALAAQLEAQKAAVAKVLDANAELIRSEDEAAAADARHSAAGQALLATLREQIAVVGLTSQQLTQRSANAGGVGGQASALLEELNARKAVQAQLADAEREEERVLNETAAASQQAADASARLTTELQRQIDVFGKDRLAIVEHDAALRGELASVQPLVNQLRDLEAVERKEAEAVRATAQAQREAEQALKNRVTQQQTFIASLKDEIATQGKTRQEILAYRAAQLGVSDEAKGFITQLKGIETGGHGASGSIGGSSGLTRELIVLTHELSQGNFSRFGGSLLVLGEIATGISASLVTTAITVVALAAPFVIFAGLLAKGAHDADVFNKSLILTNDYAGLTAAGFHRLAESVEVSAGVTIGSAKQITQELVSTGRFGPEAIGHVAVAVADLERLTGESADKIVGEFASMSKGVADWAEKSNEKYHFLTLAVYLHIKALEDQGRAEEAMIVASDKLHESLDKQKENLGLLARAYREVKDAISATIDAVDRIGAKPTGDDLVTSANKRLDDLIASRKTALELRQYKPNDFPADSVYGKQIEDARTALAAIRDRVKAEEDGVKIKADGQKLDSEAIAAAKENFALRQKLREGDKADLEIQKYLVNEGKIRNANLNSANPLPQSNNRQDVLSGTAIAGDKLIEQDLAAIRLKDGSKNAREAENAILAIIHALEKEDAGLKQQIKEYDTLGFAADHAAEAKLNAALADPTTNASKASPAQQSKARSLAQDVDRNQAIIGAEKGLEQLQKQIQLIHEEASAQAENTRESQYAVVVGKTSLQIQATGSQDLIAKRDKLLAQLKEEINLRADNKLRVELKAQSAGVDEEANRLDTENTLLGLNTIERTKALAVLKLEAEARKQLVANPNSGPVIDASLARNTDAITEALDRNYEAQRKFETGAKQAFTAYAEAAGNAADFAKTVIGDGLKDLNDALFTFYKTGKFSLSKFLQDLADDFLKQTSKMQIKKLLDEDSVKNNIDKVVDFLKGLYGTKSELKVNQGEGILNSGNASEIDTFRKGEIASQNEAGAGTAAADAAGVSTASAAITEQTAAVTASSTAFTALVGEGLTPASAGFTTLLGEGLTPATAGLGVFAGEGLTGATAGLSVFDLEGVAPATLALTEFALALQEASLAAAADSSGSSDSGLGGLFSSAVSAYAEAANGGVMSSSGLDAFAGGGVMTKYGRLQPEHYSIGGIADRPRLAVFGEGRKREAFIPMDDGMSIPVSVKTSGGKQVAYVPLPGGRSIPVSMQMDSYSGPGISAGESDGAAPASAFANGGVMSSQGSIGYFADGGVAGYGSSPSDTGYTGTMPVTPQDAKKAGGDTIFVLENHGATVTKPEETTRPNGDKEIRMIIDIAKKEAKAELTSDVANGRGDMTRALRARGLDSSRTLQRRG